MNIQLVNFPKISDSRGNLTFIQYPNQIPFEIKRVFWTYNIPGGETRGGHAFKTQEEIIVAISGSFDVVITHRAGHTECIQLKRGYEGLYLPPNTWRHLENFSTNSVSLHLSNIEFDANDYVYDFEEFRIVK